MHPPTNPTHIPTHSPIRFYPSGSEGLAPSLRPGK